MAERILKNVLCSSCGVYKSYDARSPQVAGVQLMDSYCANCKTITHSKLSEGPRLSFGMIEHKTTEGDPISA